FFEQTALVHHGSGERPLLVTEQFRLEQIFRQCATIDGDKRMMLAIAVEMKTARNQLLARAAFAHNQHRAVRVGDFADQVVDVLHLPARANDVFESVTVLDRKSTRLNSSHVAISYAVFCLKKKI